MRRLKRSSFTWDKEGISDLKFLQDHRFYRALAVAWMLLIFYLSSRNDIPNPSFIWGQDKIFHVLIFGILGFLLVRAYRSPTRSSRVFMWAILIVLGYGLFDELHQCFVPGRFASAWDLLADAVGGTLGAIVSLNYHGRLRNA
jgi:VanZ family protein